MDADDVDDTARPSRRQTALIVVVVGLLLAGGVVAAVVIGSSEPAAEPPLIAPLTQGDEPVLTLPPGCQLLTPGQVGALVPGQATTAGRGPELVVDQTESACTWDNATHEQTEPSIQLASLDVTAAAAPNEDAAKTIFRTSLPCHDARGEKVFVSGSDEACILHKSLDREGNPRAVATVSARFQTLVVEVTYQRPDWPVWRIDDQTEVTAAALIGSVVRYK
jgi:hypothetical protein